MRINVKILAIDSSGLVASVAIVENDNLLAEYTMNYKKTHSQTLLPMLDEIKNMIELDLQTIDAIAVAAGPGSFTGLRIGSATAKGLGLALNKPIIPVPTVNALAYNLYGTESIICPLMDARRNQVYTGLYRFRRKENEPIYVMETIKEQCAVDIQEIIELINENGQEVIFLGDGVPVFQEKLAQYLTVSYTFAPASCNRQRAASVGVLGRILYDDGVFQTPSEHAPDYLRLSQAERERKEKETQQ